MLKHKKLSEMTKSPLAAAILNPLYLRAAIQRKPGMKDGQSVPRIERHIYSHRPDAKLLKNLREISSTPDDGLLPLTYPHIVGQAMQLENMIDHRFPLPIMGTVHIRSSIKQFRTIREDETFDLACIIEGHRDTDKGIEFDLTTIATDQKGQTIWSSDATMLNRKKNKGSDALRKDPKPLPDFDEIMKSGKGTMEEMQVDLDVARSYAMCSGDLNPIHLHDVTAKMFGFRRSIIHGLWTLARMMGLMIPKASFPLAMTCEFKLPVFLPARIKGFFWEEDNKTQFYVVDKDAIKPHMVGYIERIEHG